MANYGTIQKLQAEAIVDQMVDRGVGGGSNTTSDAPVITELALTAPGSTPARSMLGYNKFTYQANLTGVGTNVVVRTEGNVAGASFVNLNANNQDITLTANGSYLFVFDGKLTAVRFTLVSINGGTPSIVSYLLRGN